MQFKCIRIRWTTWIQLRKDFPGEKDETFNNYISRLHQMLIEMKQWKK